MNEQSKCKKQEEMITVLKESVEKLTELHSSKCETLTSFQDAHLSTLQKSKKALHYEKIRLSEVHQDLTTQHSTLHQELTSLDAQCEQENEPVYKAKKRLESKLSRVDD